MKHFILFFLLLAAASKLFGQDSSVFQSQTISSMIDSSDASIKRFEYLNHKIYMLEKELGNRSEEVDSLKIKLNLLIDKQKMYEEKIKKGWRKLEMYMTISEVVKILGKPNSITKSLAHTKYWYGNGFVEFNAYKALCEWAEPRENRTEIIEY